MRSSMSYSESQTPSKSAPNTAWTMNMRRPPSRARMPQTRVPGVMVIDADKPTISVSVVMRSGMPMRIGFCFCLARNVSAITSVAAMTT